MIVIAVLLFIIGIVKLYLVSIANKMEVKELFYNTPVLVDVSPNTMRVLITTDGLICIFGGITLLYL